MQHRLPIETDPLDFRLLNDFQRNFPLEPRPFDQIAATLGCDTDTVLRRLRSLLVCGGISRIGAVFRPNTVGCSLLAAVAIPEDHLARAVAVINHTPGVNHNYRREHAFNLWFVIAAPNPAVLKQRLDRLELTLGHPILQLPLERAYHIDLGFPLASNAIAPPGNNPPYGPPKSTPHGLPPLGPAPLPPLTRAEQLLRDALSEGLPLVPTPYTVLGESCGLSTAEVLDTVTQWCTQGVVQRFGVIVRHHELGFASNAMVVFNVPDQEVDSAGARLAVARGVTLCYRRRRQPPQWPYNLYCMLHGRSRSEADTLIDEARASAHLDGWPHAVLYSIERYRQRGASYA